VTETLEQKVQRVLRENVALIPYDARWPELFRSEKEHLLASFPRFIRRIEHFGSTAVPGLPAKPIVDMLIEVADLDVTRQRSHPYWKLRVTIISGVRPSATTSHPSTHGSSSATQPRTLVHTTCT
jgi:GrpB-like predicted nucleotidyltransferase (UPF0157 family)